MIERTIKIPVPQEIAEEVQNISKKGDFVGRFILKDNISQLLARLHKEGVINLEEEKEYDVEFYADPAMTKDADMRRIRLVTKVMDDQEEYYTEIYEEDIMVLGLYPRSN